MGKILATCTLFAAMPAAAVDLPGAIHCGRWQDIKRIVAEGYGEMPVAFGQLSHLSVMAILAAPDGKTFTVVMVQADGSACITGVGRGWDMIAPPVGEGL